MIQMDEIIRQLSDSAQATRAILQTIPEEQAQWKPGPEIWSLKEVMEHICDEERNDFRKHLHEMLAEPPKSWGSIPYDADGVLGDSHQVLEHFLIEREASIVWLKSLESPNWDIVSEAPGGMLSAGDVLVSWVEHDFLHMRQIIEVLYAWNAKQASPYSAEYAGEW